MLNGRANNALVGACIAVTSAASFMVVASLHTATHVHCYRLAEGNIMPSSLKEKLETILVVDDDEAVVKVVVAILKTAPHKNTRITGWTGAVKGI
jgi:hypothetical protein